MVLKSSLALICLALLAPTAARAGPLHDAAKDGDVAQIELLLSQGADINQGVLGTPLYFAIDADHAEAAKLLIERGADVNKQSTLGAPLHAASARGMTYTVALLLDRGADLHLQWQQMTPLHIAARNGRLEVVRLLLDRGADINATTGLDEPALHFAVFFEHQDVADLLRERGTKVPPIEDVMPLLATADLSRGFEVALRCRNCHSVDREAKVKDGPPLWGIVGRKKASYENFKYSPTLKAMTGDWTYADLNDYIAHPAFAAPGLAMKMAGIHEIADRAALIAFLRTLSDNPTPLP
jgi:cytochrome c